MFQRAGHCLVPCLRIARYAKSKLGRRFIWTWMLLVTVVRMRTVDQPTYPTPVIDSRAFEEERDAACRFCRAAEAASFAQLAFSASCWCHLGGKKTGFGPGPFFRGNNNWPSLSSSRWAVAALRPPRDYPVCVRCRFSVRRARCFSARKICGMTPQRIGRAVG